MRTLAIKRILIIAVGYLYFLLVYFGATYLTASRSAATLAWDPVWHLPVISEFIVAYATVYFIPILLVVVVRNTKELLKLMFLFMAIVALCGFFFLVLPLTLPRPPIAQGGIFNGLLIWQYLIDAPSNMFPSIHVAVSLLVAFVVGSKRPSFKWWVWSWVLLIAISTLFIRQHYVVDIAGAFIVTFIAWHVFLRLNPTFGVRET